jgi:hypothetical protein
MPDTNGNDSVEKGGRGAYDGRFAAIEARIAAGETEMAVIRASFATKDDIQLLRTEMRDGHERILTLLYEHKLEMKTAMAQQREDFNAALGTQREEFTAALARQREEFAAALARQRDDFYAMHMRLQREILSQMWKLSGFASLLIGGVYFIARYVH